jgi:CDP-diglyceride synthetase
MRVQTAGRVAGAAVLAGLVMYIVPVVIFRQQASPVTIIAVALFIGVIEYRKLNRKPAVSDAVWIGIAIAALVLYTGALIAGAVPDNPGDWLAMAVIFALPILLLVQIFAKKNAAKRSKGH